ncbi:MAG: TIR domain-containing protein [Oculatellaceae cyanobacterium Prado106]|jgi:hypothetical protein|nr:TIR domain-containing protein [Oculatellaceae cyanobacterium Prado106]
MTYVYDIFISYRRRPPVEDWVRYHFYPLLKKWLPQSMPREPMIFIDVGVETGTEWAIALENALKSSRCLLPVLSPDYFRSNWCLAEWQSMIEREQQLGLRTAQNPNGIIYPVVFSDGEHFPDEAKQIQQRDLRKWNSSYLSFAETKGIVELEQQVQELSEELWNMLQRVPPWQDFPVVTPKVSPNVTVHLPRLQ